MAFQDQYINPFTDFSFKKQEDELEINFDKWRYVLKHLPDLQNRPAALQERISQIPGKTIEEIASIINKHKN